MGGFLVALAAVGLFGTYAQAQRASDTRFAVAARDLPVGTRLSRNDVVMVAMDLPDTASTRAFPRVGLVEGQLLIGPVAKGELVQAGSVLPQDRTPPFREITVQVDAGQARSVAAGDTVDVLVTSGTAEAPRTDVVVGGARIIRVGGTGQSFSSSDAKPPVTFAVSTFEDVTRLVQASHAGSLTLVRANGFAPQSPTFRAGAPGAP